MSYSDEEQQFIDAVDALDNAYIEEHIDEISSREVLKRAFGIIESTIRITSKYVGKGKDSSRLKHDLKQFTEIKTMIVNKALEQGFKLI